MRLDARTPHAQPIPAPKHGLDIGHGDDFTDNCRYLAERLVRIDGAHVVVGGLPNSRTQRVSCVKFKGGLDERDALRDVVYDLLVSVTDEAQRRFPISERYALDNGNVRLEPDQMLGGRLQREIAINDKGRAKAKKADSSESA